MSDQDFDTRPTIETVLERINTLGESLGARLEKVETRLDGIETRVGELSSEVKSMRSDIDSGFRKVERKIELLNRDFLTIRADQEHLLQRIEGLESKAS